MTQTHDAATPSATMTSSPTKSAVGIRITGLTKSYGDTTAVRDLDLEIHPGELLVLLGPSGCGKTTTMRCIVGLEEPETGRIEMGDKSIFDSRLGINIPVNKRNVGMVFQSYAIWPHKTVFENVAFPLEVRRLPSRTVSQRVAEILDLVGLAQYANRGASQLSGGQMQRVALARSVIMEPSVLLLDEPLSNLDAKLRDRLRIELRKIQQKLGITTVYVTHDQAEALALADRIAVMREGRIVQLDAPQDLYRDPVDRFVADFIGSSNLFATEVLGVEEDGRIRVRLPSGDELVAESAPQGGQAFVCVRPEIIQLIAPDGNPTENTIEGHVLVELFMGNHVFYEIEMKGGGTLRALDFEGALSRPAGSEVTVRIPPTEIRLLGD